MSVGLTPKQRELLAYLSEREVCPTFTEMQQALGLSSKSQITPLLHRLEERGHIRRRRYRHCAIEVLQPPVIINGNRYRFIPKTRAG